MICSDYDCKMYLPASGLCAVYRKEGQEFRDRMGHCPILGDGPKDQSKKARTGKRRVGQQKQRKV